MGNRVGTMRCVRSSDCLFPVAGALGRVCDTDRRTTDGGAPDESRIDLNTDTLIRITSGRQARTVVLERGEATFRVARDPGRPFEVLSQQGVARALGTEFNVMSLANGVTVTVLSEKSKCSQRRRGRTLQRPDGVILSAGQEVSYRGTRFSQLHAADT